VEAAIFYILAGTALLAALLVVGGRRPVHSALGLVAVALCVALLCAQLGAGFLAAALALLYAGGIGLVFILIAVLLNLRSERGGSDFLRTFAAGALAVALLAQLGGALWRWNSGSGSEELAATPTTAELSELLFGAFRLPLEVVALLLLTSLVGAALLTLRDRKVPGDGKVGG
jgi:NADH-quinone oxidoreductase subunit J